MGKSGSEKKSTVRPTCTKLGKVLCAALFGNDSAVSGKSDTRATFSSPPRGALLFSALEKKEEGAVPFPKRVRSEKIGDRRYKRTVEVVPLSKGNKAPPCRAGAPAVGVAARCPPCTNPAEQMLRAG